MTQKLLRGGDPQRYSELVISPLMNLPLRCPAHSSISKRAKSVGIPFKNSTRDTIAHLVINSKPATD